MRVYIGAPIDTANADCTPREQFENLARVVRRGLGEDVVIYNPLAAFADSGKDLHDEDLGYFHDVNTRALQLANVAVFVWNGSPSFGVPLEIADFSRRGQPMVLYNTSDRSLGVYARFFMRNQSIVRSSDELVEVLQKLKAGVARR